jgi:hypothetical protein
VYHVCSVIYYARYLVLGHIWLLYGYFKNTHINTSCDVLFKTLVKVTWKWVIYYRADALKSLCRWQYRTRTLKKRYTEEKTLSSSKELTSWVKLQVQIFCKARLRLALQNISTCSLTHDVSSLEDDNIKCTVFFLAFKENPFFSILIKQN